MSEPVEPAEPAAPAPPPAEAPPAPAPPPAAATEEEAPESAETALFFRMSAERLRARCLWGGIILVASLLLPYELAGDRGVWVWNVLGELDPAATFAALSPAFAGLFLVLLGLRREGTDGLVVERPTSRAIAVLATFVFTNAAIWIGRRSSAWGVLPLPDSFTTRPAPLLAVFALTAAGSALRFRPRTRRAGSALLLGSIAAALVFYLAPTRGGEIPARTIARSVALVATLSDVRLQIGYGMVLLFALWPLVVALLGLVHVRKPPTREHPALALLAVWGLPLFVLLFVYRAFLAGGIGVQTMATGFFALVILAVVAPLASATEVLVEGVLTPDATLEVVGGLRPRLAGGIAAGAVVVGLGALWVAGRPAPKGVDWRLGKPSDEAEKLYGELIPKWERARLARDEHARAEGGTGASAQVAAKARAREMLALAKTLPTGGGPLADALSTLSSEVDDLELSGRAFARLVGVVNDRAREAELPYYLDPNVSLFVSKKGTERIFFTAPYRVKEVHGWRVGGQRFATLLVEPLTGEQRAHLGFSRDADPFALVLENEVARYTDRFASGDRACGSAVTLRGGEFVDRSDAVATCAAALRKVRDRAGLDLRRAILRMTERHELQHQVDGPHLPRSSAVSELLAGYSEESQDAANRELSAYLAEMTTEDAPPLVTLVHLFPFGVISRSGAEHRVAVIVVETLAGRKLRFGAREVDPVTFASAFESLADKSDEELRRLARKAYEEHFGSALLDPERE